MVETREHWFGFGDDCISVSECFTQKMPENSQNEAQIQRLFFLHGRFGHAGIWEPVARRLASRFRCFQVDLPGFGRSFSSTGRAFSLADHSRLVQKLVRHFTPAPERAILVGHDVGGAIAQLCAIHEPDSVAALVLINSCALTRAPSSLKTGIFCHRARRSLKKMLNTASARLTAAHRRLLSEAWRDRFGRTSLARAFGAWEYTWPGPAERKIWSDEIARLNLPVLLLWGLRDPINSQECAAELLRQFPDAYLFEHDVCGHWPSLEVEDWVDTKMREFLFRLSHEPPLRRFA